MAPTANDPWAIADRDFRVYRTHGRMAWTCPAQWGRQLAKCPKYGFYSDTCPHFVGHGRDLDHVEPIFDVERQGVHDWR